MPKIPVRQFIADATIINVRPLFCWKRALAINAGIPVPTAITSNTIPTTTKSVPGLKGISRVGSGDLSIASIAKDPSKI